MLPSERDQVPHWWVGAPLSQSSQKLAPLRETHGMVAVAQFTYVANLLANLSDVSVNVAKESTNEVVEDAVSNLQRASLEFFALLYKCKEKYLRNQTI